jgi:hypothetical protein
VVEQNYHAAYMMAREQDRATLSEEQFVAILKQTHPTGFPVSVVATEYQPVPGQPAIEIFLQGRNEKEAFYYRVPMVGTVDEGYFPKGLFRSSQPAYLPALLRRSV